MKKVMKKDMKMCKKCMKKHDGKCAMKPMKMAKKHVHSSDCKGY